MGRIVAIDFGKKRTGLAVTDPLQIIATSLKGVETKDLHSFLENYFAQETVVKVIIGYPLNLDGSPTDATKPVENFIRQFKNKYPTLPIQKVDEQYTSKMAVEALVQANIKKKDRQNKLNIDIMSATIMLQDYLKNQ